MANLESSPLEQQICLHAVVANGRLAATNLVTTRAGGIAGILVTQPIADVPRILSQLFPLCGTAHAVASLAAIEKALQIAVSPGQRAFRELMVLAEYGAALAWRIMMDWPPLLGEPMQVRACTDLRRAVAVIHGAAGRDRWAQVGGASIRLDRDDLARAVCELARMLGDLFPEAADWALSWRTLDRAVQDGTSMPARLINAARTGALADYGCHNRPLLPVMDSDWFSVRLVAEPGFGDTPTLDGTPAEVGPLAAQRHPLIADAVAHWDKTLATRLLAAALDLPVAVERLQHAHSGLRDDDPVAVDLWRPGRGAAVVETARGPLAYLVDVADGQLRMLRSVAPTEWNFHPEGPFRAALDAAPEVPDPVFAARLLAASFDPCVPFSIELSAPPDAGTARHA